LTARALLEPVLKLFGEENLLPEEWSIGLFKVIFREQWFFK